MSRSVLNNHKRQCDCGATDDVATDGSRVSCEGSIDQIQLDLNVRGVKPSATVAINDRSNELRRQGFDIFRLGLGQSPFPVPELVVDALRENAPQKDYLPVAGLYELREAIADHYRATLSIECTPEDVLIGPGSKLLMFLLQLCYYGDLVIPTPAWVSYAPQAKIIGRHIFRLRTSMKNDWLPTAEQLEEFCRQDRGRPRVLVLNYPCNPTGRTLSHDRLKELAEVAADNHVIILSDEIYGRLHHEGSHESIASLCPDHTIVSSGLSKWCGAGGWRIGFFIFPRKLHWLRDAMAAVGTESFTATSAPIQYAAVRAFQEEPEIEFYLQHSRRVLKAIGGLLAERLVGVGAKVLRPQGAFYLFPDFSPFRDGLKRRGIYTSADMCSRLLDETGVAILPGSDFGRPPEELTARLAYVDFDGEAVLKSSQKVPLVQDLDAHFVSTYCGRVVEAVDRICYWLAATSHRGEVISMAESVK